MKLVCYWSNASWAKSDKTYAKNICQSVLKQGGEVGKEKQESQWQSFCVIRERNKIL